MHDVPRAKAPVAAGVNAAGGHIRERSAPYHAPAPRLAILPIVRDCEFFCRVGKGASAAVPRRAAPCPRGPMWRVGTARAKRSPLPTLRTGAPNIHEIAKKGNILLFTF